MYDRFGESLRSAFLSAVIANKRKLVRDVLHPGFRIEATNARWHAYLSVDDTGAHFMQFVSFGVVDETRPVSAGAAEYAANPLRVIPQKDQLQRVVLVDIFVRTVLCTVLVWL